jgi:hypothetical protein
MITLKQLREKALTAAEKKKREEIAKAMERDNPDMPMDKKMAIATATAKRVAEGTKQILAHGGKGKYKVVSDGGAIDVRFRGKSVGKGDFDRGADSFFISIKGERGQRSFDSAQAIADYFAKNKITEEVELGEGTWAVPDTNKKKEELKKLMSKPIKLGKEGDEAKDKLYSLIGDDELFDDLAVAGKKNPNGDARPVVSKWMKKNFKGSWAKYTIEEVQIDEKKGPKIDPAKMAAHMARNQKPAKPKKMSSTQKSLASIRELSKDKLGQYIKHSTSDVSRRASRLSTDYSTKSLNKLTSRQAGIHKAVDRLTKKDTR